MNNRYEDIIHLPHHVSTQHPRLSMEARAAQFAPFSALTGFEEAVLTQSYIHIQQEESTTAHVYREQTYPASKP